MTTPLSKYQPAPSVDEDGHCVVCGYALSLAEDTMERHTCPPGFHLATPPTVLSEMELEAGQYDEARLLDSHRTLQAQVALGKTLESYHRRLLDIMGYPPDPDPYSPTVEENVRALLAERDQLKAQVAALQKQWHDAAKLDADMDYVKDILDLKAQVDSLKSDVDLYANESVRLKARVTALEVERDEALHVQQSEECAYESTISEFVGRVDDLTKQLATAKALLVLSAYENCMDEHGGTTNDLTVMAFLGIESPLTDADLAAARKIVEEYVSK